jgi:hypothetical protein
MRRAITSAMALLLALSLLAACSSGDDGGGGSGGGNDGSGDTVTAPADYAEGLCTAIADFQTDLDRQSAELQDALVGQGTPSPADMKDTLVTFVSGLSDRTHELIDEVEALGTPDVENGEEVRSNLTGAFETVVAAFDEAEADIEALPTDDPAALVQGFTDVGTKLQEAGTEISTSFGDIQSPELDEAAADVEACSGVI